MSQPKRSIFEVVDDIMTSIARAGPVNTGAGLGHSQSSKKDAVSGFVGYNTGIVGQKSKSP